MAPSSSQDAQRALSLAAANQASLANPLAAALLKLTASKDEDLRTSSGSKGEGGEFDCKCPKCGKTMSKVLDQCPSCLRLWMKEQKREK